MSQGDTNVHGTWIDQQEYRMNEDVFFEKLFSAIYVRVCGTPKVLLQSTGMKKTYLWEQA